MGLSEQRIALDANADVAAVVGTGFTRNGEFKIGIVVGRPGLLADVVQTATVYAPAANDLSRVFRSFASTD